MKCLYCGKETKSLLCESCRTPKKLDVVFKQLMNFKYDESDNFAMKELYDIQERKWMGNNIIPLLSLFDRDTVLYYYVRFYSESYSDKDKLLPTCLEYLEKYPDRDDRREEVLYRLINFYKPPKEFEAQECYCEYVSQTEGLYPELYISAANYYDCVGEYELAEKILNYIEDALNKGIITKVLFRSVDDKKKAVSEQREKLIKHRDVKPYWPKEEENQEKLKPIYARKGIIPAVRTKKSLKVKESDFQQATEYFGEPLKDYVAFWCYECSGMKGRGICQIAAVIVKNGVIVDKFQEYVQPWDHVSKLCEMASKKLGVPAETFETAETVDKVIKKFYEFVGNNVLISTGALGEQNVLLSRATRYAGFSKIENMLMDILDYAADVNSDYDLGNNNREYIMKDQGISEGYDSLEKAVANMKLYEILKGLDK